MNDLTQLLERATDDLHPDVTALVAGATSRGRRLRTRRRFATGLGATAAVAAVGAAGLTAPAFIGNSRQSDLPVASQPKASTRVTAELPTLQGLTSGRVVKMPGGSTLIDSWGSRDRGFVAASWRVTPEDGSGVGQIQILVEYADSRYHDDASRTKDGKSLDAAASKHAAVAADPCAEAVGRCVRLADGYLNTFTAPEPLSGGGDSAVIGAHAELWRAGLHLSAVAYNSMGEKDTATTRETPVLTDDQLGGLLRTFDGA